MGTKYRYSVFSPRPDQPDMVFGNSKIRSAIATESKKEMMTEMASVFAASFSLSDNIMAISYLKVAMEPIMPVMDIKMAKTPKLAGVYKRDNMGDSATGISWAMVVPVININTFFEKSETDVSFLSIFKTEQFVKQLAFYHTQTY